MKSQTRFRGRIFLATATGVVMLAPLAASPALAQACESTLANTGFRCDVRQEGGGGFSNCLSFISPTTANHGLDGYVTYHSEPLTCRCLASGSFKNPKFDATNSFMCTTRGSAAWGISVLGKITNGLNKSLKVQFIDEGGLEYYALCKPDPNACPIGVGLSSESTPAQDAPPRLAPARLDPDQSAPTWGEE